MNAKSFIRIRDKEDFPRALEVIRHLDENDEAYLAMLKEPAFLDSDHRKKFDVHLETFLLNIFEQPLEKAYRRGFGQWRCNLEKRYKKAQKIRYYSGIPRYFCRSITRAVKNYFKA